MQQPTAMPLANWSQEGFANQTVRQVIRVSKGGPAVRVRLSNLYGKAPLKIAGATVDRLGQGASAQPLRFPVVPAGKEVVSEPVWMPVRPLEDLTISLYFAEPTGPATFHMAALTKTYRAAGDHLGDSTGFTDTSNSWYFLSGADVLGSSPRAVVVAFGDSFTDGGGSTWYANNRYPDELAELRPGLAVLNAGIGGNRILNNSPCSGESALARFERDALDQPGVGTVILLEGINDIGYSEVERPCYKPNPRVTAAELIAGLRKLIGSAKARGVKVIGSTLMPFKGGHYYTERGEAVRNELNDWIRTSGEYDVVVDLAQVMADPADVYRMNPAYDSGDGLHPNDAGHHAIAKAILGACDR